MTLPFGWLTVSIVVLVDQLTKIIALHWLRETPRITLLPFLNLIPAWNRGVSFSFLSANTTLTRWLLVGLTSILSLIIVALMAQAKTRLSMLGYAFILGGAIGNLIDRIRLGAVFDFIDVVLYKWHFYTFNGADSFITLGVGCVLLEYMLTHSFQKR